MDDTIAAAQDMAAYFVQKLKYLLMKIDLELRKSISKIQNYFREDTVIFFLTTN